MHQNTVIIIKHIYVFHPNNSYDLKTHMIFNPCKLLNH